MLKRLLPIGCMWVLMFVLWLLFVDTFDGIEMAVGAITSLIAAVAIEGPRKRRLSTFGFSRTALSGTRHIARSLFTDTYALFAALLADLTGRKPVRGAFRAVPFDTGADDEEDAPARAAAAFKLSIAPNTYVVDLDTDEKLIVVHQFVPGPKDGIEHELRRSL